MIVYFIYIARIFSENYQGLSTLIGAVILMLFLSLFLIGKIDISSKQFNFFLKFWVVYSVVAFCGVFIGYIKYGIILVKPGIYYTMKPIALIAIYYLLSSECLMMLKKVRSLVNTIIFIYTTLGVYSMFSVLGGMVDRAAWPTFHPNSLGIIFAFLIGYIIMNFNSSQSKMYDFICMLFLGGGLFATKSLSAIGIFIIMISLYYLNDFKLKSFFIFFIFFIFFYLFIGDVFISDRLSSLTFNYRTYIDLWDSKYLFFRNSFEWRIANWRVLYDQFLMSPLWGHGTVSWKLINPFRNFSGELGGFNPHSEIFNWLVQFGLIGTFVLIYITIRTFIFYLKDLQRTKYFKSFDVMFLVMLISGFLGKELYLQLCYISILIYFDCVNKEKRDLVLNR